jgi:hypothetical protein
MSEEFVPPYIEVGLPVQWFPHRDADQLQKPLAATVTQINPGSRTVNVKCHGGGRWGEAVFHGVRHVDDPHQSDPRFYKNGYWRHVPVLEKALAIMSQLEGDGSTLRETALQPACIGPGSGYDKRHVPALEKLQQQLDDLRVAMNLQRLYVADCLDNAGLMPEKVPPELEPLAVQHR